MTNVPVPTVMIAEGFRGIATGFGKPRFFQHAAGQQVDVGA